MSRSVDYEKIEHAESSDEDENYHEDDTRTSEEAHRHDEGTLTAEEAACREAMYVLQKAVDRGRISGSDFVRQMRGLGRESFLKMVLARKCARGLGLDADH